MALIFGSSQKSNPLSRSERWANTEESKECITGMGVTQILSRGDVFRVKAESLRGLVRWGNAYVVSSSVLAQEYSVLLSAWTLGAWVLHPNSDSAIFRRHDFVQVI